MSETADFFTQVHTFENVIKTVQLKLKTSRELFRSRDITEGTKN